MEKERIEMKEMLRCPVFSGNEAEYENWRVIACDWMMIEGKKRVPGFGDERCYEREGFGDGS